MHVLPPLGPASPHLRPAPYPGSAAPALEPRSGPALSGTCGRCFSSVPFFFGTYPFFPLQCRLFSPSPRPAPPPCHQRPSRCPRQPGRRRRGGGGGGGGGHPDRRGGGDASSPLTPLNLGRGEGKGGGDQNGGERGGGSRREGEA